MSQTSHFKFDVTEKNELQQHWEYRFKNYEFYAKPYKTRLGLYCNPLPVSVYTGTIWKSVLFPKHTDDCKLTHVLIRNSI